MDPITQGCLGAAVALLLSPKPNLKQSAIVGALGGMAADLDVLIRSSEDSLLQLQYHRHFTHSLVFVPLGAAIVALFWWAIHKKRFRYSDLYWPALAGYATHGLLDAFTSYGTMLWWPISSERVSWSYIAIVDPVYTLLLVAGIYLSLKGKSARFLALSFFLSSAYLGWGGLQKFRAESTVRVHLSKLGTREFFGIDAKPTVFNNWLWRVNYSLPGRHCVMAVHLSLWGESKLYDGECLPSLGPLDVARKIPAESLLAQDIVRFSWFSQNIVGPSKNDANFISDFRYSFLPNSLDPMWGIVVNFEQPYQRAHFEFRRQLSPEVRDQFAKMLMGADLQ